jgi:hypothetical protein
VRAEFFSDGGNEHSFSRPATLIVAVFAILALCAGSATPEQPRTNPAAKTQTHQTEQTADGQLVFRKMTPEMRARAGTSLAKLQPSVRQWIREQARAESQQPAPDSAALERAIRARFGKKLTDADVAELEFVVLMSSFPPQYNALLESVGEVKAHTAARQALEEAIGEIGDDVVPNTAAGAKADTNAHCTTAGCRSLAEAATRVAGLTAQTMHPLRYDLPSDFTYAQAQEVLQQMRRDLSVLNLSSEAEQQKLQMAQQRWSQMMDIISNAMNAMNATTSGVVQNLK